MTKGIVTLYQRCICLLVIGSITGTIVGIYTHAIDTIGHIGQCLMIIVVAVVELCITILLEARVCACPTGIVVIVIRGVCDVSGIVGRRGGRHLCGLELHYQPYEVVGSLT